MTLLYDKISSLNPIRDNWNVLARVIRLWSTHGGGQITGIDFILMDDQIRIQATVRKYLAPKYEKLIRSDSLVPPTIWDFVKYDDVLSGALDESLLLDVIGILSRVGEQRNFGGGKMMKQIVLDNFGVIVKELLPNVIGARVVTRTNAEEDIWIPRMSMVPNNPSLPFKFERRQFLVTICFAMTINKSQSQTLSNVGLYLRNPVFTYGQLYVAISRVMSKRGLKVLILDEENKVVSSTKNVVYNEVFDNL
ncbi:hypothetical protein OROGR_032108 [Orobanche gracilis]